MIAGFIAVALLVAFVRWRARRRSMLSGLEATRPVFSVEPPTRRMSRRRWEAL